jgi:hypothetical protein
MPKPTESVLVWINGLAPADELTVRIAMVMTNEWCVEDPAWHVRIAQLRSTLVKSDGDGSWFEDKAREMARDMEQALRSIAAQPPDTVDR